MLVVFVNDTGKYGVLLGSGLSRAAAIVRREMSGDLLLDEDFQIDPGTDWLFPWELLDPTCYARRKQAERASFKGFEWCLTRRMGRAGERKA